MKNELNKIRKEAKEKIFQAKNEKELNSLRVLYLGRKGEVSKLLKSISQLNKTERPKMGAAINELKTFIQETLAEAVRDLEMAKFSHLAKSERLDVTKPVGKITGENHLVTDMTHKIWQTFQLLGFKVVLGPEIETDEMNFKALNVPDDHPARDMQDTFYLSNNLLLRTHTSSVQGRIMQKEDPPLRVISTGKCFRRDDDMTHTPMFHQFEGFVIDKNITMADLKGTLTQAMRLLLNDDKLKGRFRISYFPFVEPGAEFDVTCTICGGKGLPAGAGRDQGCRTCKGTGWIEMGGCGMVHPNVLEYVGYEKGKWQGFAFGFGIERPLMIKHRIPDLRMFYENDIRFLSQF
ncbi:MAG: phenylalanine--tRNA ligase subunit alpha [bacterium]